MTATDSGTIGGREFVDLRNIYAADFHSMHGCAQFLLEECTADRSWFYNLLGFLYYEWMFSNWRVLLQFNINNDRFFNRSID